MNSRTGLSEAVQRHLVAYLYNQTPALIVAGLAFTAIVALSWVRTNQAWFLVWAVLSLVVLAGRAALQFAYSHRRDPDGEARPWRLRFIAGAWATGAVWGGVALTVLWHTEPLVQMFLFTVSNVIIMGGAARNASCPAAARGQTLFGLVPLAVVCASSPDPYYRAFSVFLVFSMWGAHTLVYHLYDHHLRLLRMDEQNIVLVNDVREANLELAAVNRQLEHAATTDSLTGIANRRRFDSTLAEEVRRAQREQSELALLILDIDAFKGFNDLYGHQAGDACLERVAAALARCFRRPGDLIARYGGEEFAAVLPRTDIEGALAFAEGVRRDVEALALRSAASAGGVVTVSVGVASFRPGHFLRPEDFIRSADAALYAAKGSGRNCVRAAALDDALLPTDALAPSGAPGRRVGAPPEEHSSQ